MSQDKVVSKEIMDMCKNHSIYMQEYSAPLFSHGNVCKIKIVNELPYRDLIGQYVFVENPAVVEEGSVEKIILYRWNRKYPADQYFPIDLTEWVLSETKEFSGNSHEKITKEIYVRK
ncbi:MAG: ribonuclease Z [Oliverpabstia sp.]